MTIEQFLTETARLQLCTALLEQLKTEEGRAAIIMTIPDLVKHTLAEQRSYRYGNTEVNAIEAMFRSLFEDEKLKTALREAVTAGAKEWLASPEARRFLADYCGEQLRRRLTAP